MIDSILPFLFAHVILFVGLLYTQPSSSARFFLQFVIVVCCFISVRSTFSLNIPGQAGGQYIYGMMMHSSHFMLLAKASAATHAEPGTTWKWAMDMLFSARWGVSPKMLPSFCRKDRSYVPAKERFLLTRCWDLIWTVAVIYLIHRYPLNIYRDDFTTVPDGLLHRLSSVTPREWAIRIYITLLSKGEPYLALRAGHSVVSIVGVAGGDSPERYPPLFGSIKEAYRVRRFYVSFWHHLIRKAFTMHSSFVINKVFQVPHGTTSRYLVLAFTFLMSAGMHVFVAPNVPLRCSAWPQLRYYFSIAGAIIIEDMATLAYRRIFRQKANQTKSKGNTIESKEAKGSGSIRDNKPTEQNGLQRRSNFTTGKEVEKVPHRPDIEPRTELSPTIARTLGYLWVACFEVWSTSKFLYLTQQCLAN